MSVSAPVQPLPPPAAHCDREVDAARPLLVHLIDGLAGEGGLCAVAASSRLDGFGHALWLIGDARFRDAAASLGLTPACWINPPLGRAQLAWPALRTRASQRPLPAAAVCWGLGTVRLARLAFPRQVRVVRAEIAPAADARPARAGHVMLPPPLMPLPAVSPASRAAARTRLGLRPTDLAVLHLPDSAASADVARFARCLSMAATAGRSLVGLVSTESPPHARARGARFLAATGVPCELVRFDGPLMDAARAADAAAWDQAGMSACGAEGDEDCGMAVASTLAATGVPVLAAPTPGAAWVLGGGPGPLVARGHSEHHWADLLANFADDPGRVVGAAQARAVELGVLHGAGGFLDAARRLME